MKFFTYQRLCAIVFFYAFSVLLYAGITLYDGKKTESDSNKVELIRQQSIVLKK